MTKISIFGIGGVGGYLGARLASFYEKSGTEVFFIARKESKEAIEADGLVLEFKGSAIIGHPKKVSANPADFGVCDYVLFCAKNYSADDFLEIIKPCVGKDTVLMSFANGIEAYEKIKKAFPENLTAAACAYIISQIAKKGLVKCMSANPLFLFGKPDGCDARLENLEKIFKDADINAKCTSDILNRVWSKFAFISPLSTAMAYYGVSYAKFRADVQADESLKNLLREFCEVAKASCKTLPDTLFDDTLASYDKLMPSDSTTSMQRDFLDGKKSELDSLTGYISKLGASLGIKTPNYDKFYELLRKKEALALLNK